MKAITLTQPWATLVAIGAKSIETRSWGTRFVGPVAIHAAKGFPLVARQFAHEWPFGEALRSAGYRKLSDLPLGAIVAVARIVGCYSTSSPKTEQLLSERQSDEREFGNYEPNRYAWVLGDVRRVSEPIPIRGALGLWTLPYDIGHSLAALAQQEISA